MTIETSLTPRRHPYLALASTLLWALVIAPQVASVIAGETATPAAAPRTRNVVILVIDGPRMSETWSDPARALIPRMAKDLAPQGVLYTDFRNDGMTTTEPGHTAMVTGVYEVKDNRGKELPKKESIFQRFRASWDLPASAAWVIASKDKLWTLSDTSQAQWTGRWRPSIDCGKGGLGGKEGPAKRVGYRSDAETFARVRDILAKDHPRLVLVNLLGPDSAGHKNDWDGYRKAISACDGFAADLWNLLQADPVYRDATALLITNDHGRHLDGVANGFVDHGCECEGCRSISCLALGPDFKRGVPGGRRRGLVDVSATTAAILGFSLPAGKGEVMTELFLGDRLPAYAVAPAAEPAKAEPLSTEPAYAP